MARSSLRRIAARARRTGVPVALGLAVLGIAGLPVGTADIVTTKDGVVVEGAVERTAAEVIVRTSAGEVRLPAASVASVVAGDSARTEARRALDALPAADVTARYRLAASLEAKGLADVAAHAYASILAVEPDHRGAARSATRRSATVGSRPQRHAARGLVPTKAPGASRRGRPHRARQATPDRGARHDLAAAMRAAPGPSAGLAAAASQQVAAAPVGERLHAATGLLVHPEPRVRAWAAGELGRLGDESALRPLWSVAARPQRRRAAGRRHVARVVRPARRRVPAREGAVGEHPSIVVNAATARRRPRGRVARDAS
jgi:hypothetical protein